MKPDHLPYLRCPQSGRPLELVDAVLEGGRVRSGTLLEKVEGRRYPIEGFIPRFVPMENYAKGFGFEWNTHDRTQYDETSQHGITVDRFYNETRWSRQLPGEMILEIGCGSGRFTREAIRTGAMVMSFDYSSAVEANYRSNGQAENVLIVQASIYEVPFPRESFDKVFCFGVLQHTPDPELAFARMTQCAKPGGRIASDVYVKNLGRWLLQPKYWVRPFVRGSDPARLYRRIQRYIDTMWPLSRLISRIPKIGPIINWKLLLPDYSRELPGAGEDVLREWMYLDAMDMLAPAYDSPQTLQTFKRWHMECGLTDIDVHYGYNGIEGRATRPI